MAKYGIFLSPDEFGIVAMKTTVGSPADGDWDSQDQHKRILAQDSKIKSLWAVEDGSDIHVATQQENGRVAYHVFDPGTDAWTTLDEQVAVVGDTNFDNAPSNPAVSLSLRSDGDVVLVAAFNDGSNETLRVFVKETNWTNEGDATNAGLVDYFSVAVMPPASDDRISWINSEFVLEDVDLKTISATNVISSTIELENTPDSVAILLIGPGVIDNADQIYIPFIDASGNVTIVDWLSGPSPSSTKNINVTDATVYGQSRTVVPFAVFCLAVDLTTGVHLLYSRDAAHDIYHTGNVQNASEDADVEINDAVDASRISCKFDSAGSNILYFYKDNGTAEVVYDTLGLENFVPSLDSFRYYEDGTETGSSAIDTQDTDINRNVDSDSDLQIRIRVQEQGAGSVGGASTDDWILQYDKNVSGFVNVTASSSNVKAFPSANITDAAVTTNRLGAGSGSFIAGEIDEANGEVTDHELTADNFTEYLWSVTLISADLANNDTLDFRVLLNAAAINSDIVPRITAVKSITTTPYYYQQLNRLQGVA